MPVRYYIVGIVVEDGLPGPTAEQVDHVLGIGLQSLPSEYLRVVDKVVHGPFPVASSTDERGRREYHRFTGYLRGN